MGAYEILVAFGSGMLIGFIAGLIVRGGVPKLTDGDPETRKRFAWFLIILYAVSIVAEIRWGYHVPMPLHVIAGMAAGWIFGVENPIPQLFGLQTQRSSPSEPADESRRPNQGSPPPEDGE